MAVASQNFARALTLGSSELGAGSLDQQTTSPDQKPNDSTAPTTAAENREKASNPGKPAIVARAGQDQAGTTAGNDGDSKNAKKAVPKTKPQGQKGAQNAVGNKAGSGASQIQNAALLMLKSLDNAVGAYHRADARRSQLYGRRFASDLDFLGNLSHS